MKVLHVFTLLTTASFFDGQFQYLGENGIDISVASNAIAEDDFCQRNSIRHIHLPITRTINPLADLKAIYRLVRIIRKNKFDVVFGHTPKGAMISMIAAKLAGTKHRVYYRHGLIYTTSKGIKHLIFKFIEKLTSSCASEIINVSPSLGELAIKDHLNHRKKQLVIGPGTCGGIDTIKLFNPKLIDNNRLNDLRRQLSIKSTDYIIGFCGRLCRDKGIIELIDAFRTFKKNGHDEAKLLLIGRYDSRDILPDHIKQNIQNSNDIIHTGLVNHNELPYYYSLMNVFVFPSYREGFGMSVIEASSMNVPVLVSRSHGCIDAIKEGVSGEYIEITAKSISEKLSELKNNRHTYDTVSRKFVTDNFEQTDLWPSILQFYNQLK